MALLFMSTIMDPGELRQALGERISGLDFRVWPDGVGAAGDIEFALVWQPPPGALKRLPNLKAILSLGAGIDHILDDQDLPQGVPVVRMVDRTITGSMAEYVLARTLYYHRGLHLFAEFQRRRLWRHIEPAEASARRVGVLGLGVIGGAAAAKLAEHGFAVGGWSRREKNLEGVECFHGPEGLSALLAGSEILVCLLPLTAATEGIVDAKALSALPREACFINVGRGGHVVDADLIAALDSGHIAGATLDVFGDEPLSEDHPFWGHPKVAMTPHVASRMSAETIADEVVGTLRRIAAGETPENTVDLERGY